MRGFTRPLTVTLAARAAIACVAAAPFAALLATSIAARASAQSPAQAPPSAVGLATAPAPSGAAPSSTQREIETSMLRWGATVVWFHATDVDSVLVFASAGFRNPFAHPIALSADDVDRWAEFVERLAVTPASLSSTPSARSQSFVNPLPDTAHLILGVGDVILESTSSSDGMALRMNIGANRQDGTLATLFPDGAPAAAAALHDAARRARSLHTTALAEAAAAAIPTPATAPLTTAPPAMAPATAATTVTTTAATTQHRASIRPVASSAGRRSGAAQNSVSQAIAGVSVRTATPSLGALPSNPNAPAPATSNPAHVAAVSLAVPTPGLAPVIVAATSVPVAAASGDRGPTGVDDITVRNLVRQWQPELMYCYTEYGLRANPDLVGSVVVRVTLAPDGTVSHAVVARHSWSGGDASDVESCIRIRASAWHFPPASSASVHEFPLSFDR